MQLNPNDTKETIMAGTTARGTTRGTTQCGYCLVGVGSNHDHCPGVIRNGDGSLWWCECPSPVCGQLRCTECNNRNVNEVGDDARCLDGLACQSRVAASARRARTKLLGEDAPEVQVVKSTHVKKNRTTTNTNKKEPIMAAKTTTTKTATKASSAAPEKGSAWLAELVSEKAGKEVSSYELRVLLRKLTKDGTIEPREGRYSFKGVTDPTVKAVLAAVKAGALDDQRKKGTAAAKATAKTTAKKAAPAKRAAKDADDEKPAPRRRRKAAPVVEDDEEFDIEEI